MNDVAYPEGPGFPAGKLVPTNGIDMYITEAGEGPPVVLCHGFPELGYSWRHQLGPLAEAGYRVIVPDQRGYGRTSQPPDITAYDIRQLTDDLLGLLDHVGEERAVFVGHDWGSIVVWNLALLAPERVEAVVGMSVPFVRRPQHRPTQLLKQLFTDNWFYMLYFQEPGVADANLGADPATALRRFMCSIDGNVAGRDTTALLGPRDGRGMLERLPEPQGIPDWLRREELDHYIAEFTRTGFTGGLNWYRNLDRNWEITPELAEARVEPPALFIGGAADPVLMMTPPATMRPYVPNLRGEVMIDGAGHWVQQEKPDEVNEALLGFLTGLKG